jgi:serine protease
VYTGNPSGQLKGTWSDNGNPLPSTITQNALASEAAASAAHFGNTTAASNADAQYIISTPTGHSTSGFGTQFCAWHSSTSSSYGTLAYTNFPYQTDAGASCGQNFVNGGSAGLLDGVSIVGGHEYGETVSDPFPNSGWLDGSGRENGDKCAWISSGQGASANITLPTGTFAVQSLWSNNFNSNAGGCVIYYASATNQH